MFVAPSGKTNHTGGGPGLPSGFIHDFSSSDARSTRLIHRVPTKGAHTATGSRRAVRGGRATWDDGGVLIVLSGLPGTGKSALAEEIAGELGAVVLSVDPIEAAMLRSGIERSFATGLAAYAVASTVAESALGRRQTVVIDAVNGVAEAKAWWPELAARAGVALAVVECVCSDQELHRSRIAGRRRGLDPLPEPTWDYVRSVEDAWVPWELDRLVVDSARPLAGNVAAAIAWIEECRAGSVPGTQKRPKEPPSP